MVGWALTRGVREGAVNQRGKPLWLRATDRPNGWDTERRRKRVLCGKLRGLGVRCEG